MRYIVVSRTSLMELQDAVNEWIRLGYKPQGGITHGYDRFSQAMIQE